MNDTPEPESAERRRGVPDREGQQRENFPSVEISKSTEAILESIVMRSGPERHPVFDKFEPEHVTQFLDNSYKLESAEGNFRRGGRWFIFLLISLAVAVFVFLTIFLVPDHLDVYTEILKIILAFLGGMGAGYGVKTYRERRESE